MVRHNHTFIQSDIMESFSQFIPYRLDHPPSIIQPHHPIHHFPKQPFPILRTNRHKIRTVLRIIIPLQPNGLTVMYVWIVFHGNKFKLQKIPTSFEMGIKNTISLRLPHRHFHRLPFSHYYPLHSHLPLIQEFRLWRRSLGRFSS